ncbi:MAG TPA: MXAN_6577-like cysteine-rich protein [Polyangia bacterium]|nr:MXAN_6577-like cysteine-rich protein [Polyangia bacterium]
MISGRASVLVLVAVSFFVAGCPNGAGLTCPNGQTFCGGQCIFVNNDPANCGACGNTCPGQLACIAGSCGCPQPLVNCGNVCVDANVDGHNCGACGNSCGPGQVCSNGSCALSCAPNLLECGNACFDGNVDPNNCGACGTKCGTFQICCSGMCVDNGTDQHCGSCAPCPNGMSCVDFGGSTGGLMCGQPG